ncbi:GumC family protein [Candidatus Nitrospira nitrificans]|uniref:non-specific protein-tyrosine kinase n=1 Tax=Candidatus Nitrospira nitrificans TaxID=1742973 RepID=A0A0S4L515_9BACT|nr:AAA family ATPase [Candidatus Nitrospira nitrificans]CUS31806.1 putative Lipopolysaccharide biosynthesis protein [Candidatus Nitrospira nitrificans]
MQSLTQEDLIRVLLKKWWWTVVSIVICMSLAYGGWKVFPKTYKSTVIITMDSPKVAKDYVKGLGGVEVKGFEDLATVAMQQVLLALTNKSVLVPIIETMKPYPDSEEETEESLIKRLRMAISVARPKEGPGIAISYQHADPHMAQAVAAFLVVKLQEDNAKRREGLVETTTEFLSVELNRMKAELEAKEQAISDFKKDHIGELPGQMEANLRTLDRLQTDLTTSSESLNKGGERLTALEKAIREFSEIGSTDVVPVERGGRMIESRPPDLRSAKLEELKQKLNELLGIYKENYPDVVHLRQEIRRLELEPRVADSDQPGMGETTGGRVESSGKAVRKPIDPFLRELMKERNELKSEMAFLKEKQAKTVRQIKELEAHVQRIPAAEQRLTILVRDYENLQKGYQSLLDKRTNARILGNYESRQFGEQYRIIEPANLPYSEEPPTRLHFLLGGLVLGCVIGLGGAIGVEFLKPGCRRPEEVESYLGLSVIASIPPFDSMTVGMGATGSRALLPGPETSISVPGRIPSHYGYGRKWTGAGFGTKRASLTSLPQAFHLIAKWGSHSIIAEQYRVASTRLLLMSAEKKNVVTLVASSIMGEGKTTTAVNLAYVLAHDLKKSTLLIDCDFKRPMVHEYMDISVEPGISEAMLGRDILENCIHHYEGIPLSILPCGDSKVRPASISGIQYVKQILPELRTRYDHVILDGPPILTLADVNVLGSLADQVILVVRAGLTSLEMVRKAVKQLNVSSDEIGVVLTKVEMEFAPYFMYETPYAGKNGRSGE